MALDMKSIPTLDKKGLREFGLVTGAIVVGLFGLGIPWLFGWNYPSWPAAFPLSWPWLIAGVLAVLALAAPMALKPVHRYWMIIGLTIGTYLMTPVIMFIVFFGMFMPFGLVMRLFGKDSMNRKLDAEAETYRVESDQPPAKNLEKPF